MLGLKSAIYLLALIWMGCLRSSPDATMNESDPLVDSADRVPWGSKRSGKIAPIIKGDTFEYSGTRSKHYSFGPLLRHDDSIGVRLIIDSISRMSGVTVVASSAQIVIRRYDFLPDGTPIFKEEGQDSYSSLDTLNLPSDSILFENYLSDSASIAGADFGEYANYKRLPLVRFWNIEMGDSALVINGESVMALEIDNPKKIEVGVRHGNGWSGKALFSEKHGLLYYYDDSYMHLSNGPNTKSYKLIRHNGEDIAW